jgi:hypothetical protein
MKKHLVLVFLVLLVATTSCRKYKYGKVVALTTYDSMSNEQRNYYFDNDVLTRVAVGNDTFQAVCVSCLNSIPQIGGDAKISNTYNNGEYLIMR